MASTPVFVGTNRTEHLQLIAAHATRFRPCWTAGSSGSRIYGIGITSADGSANTAILGIGKVITSAANMGSGVIVDGGGGSDTITRTSGSFVTDGWVIDHRLHVQGATTLANDFDTVLTGVAAGTLSFATATVSTGEALPSTARLYRILELGVLDLAANAGTAAANAAVNGLDATEIPGSPILPGSTARHLVLGSGDLLFARVGTTLGTGEWVNVVVYGGDF